MAEKALGQSVYYCSICHERFDLGEQTTPYEGEYAHSICIIRKALNEERKKEEAMKAKQILTVEIYKMTCHCCFAEFYENADDTLDYCPHCGGDQFNNENLDEIVECKFVLDNKTGLVRAAGIEPAQGN